MLPVIVPFVFFPACGLASEFLPEILMYTCRMKKAGNNENVQCCITVVINICNKVKWSRKIVVYYLFPCKNIWKNFGNE